MAKLKMLKPRIKMLDTSKVKVSKPSEWGSGRGGRPWRRIRERILLRDQYTCQGCGQITQDLEVDHIVNVAQGGSDDDANLQSLCVPCHKAKTAQESVEGRG
ncbi:HNH endonuclease [Pseudomonas typographi]|uniref:HNH endonuclease n=1 Tax=Pseudomonas typographi TaxID=2715964 RepID=UPI001684F571|nr:HNH endonuclease [Pseudomonas typographi]MBD1553623.1 HNH endonuclease [Pseudomonas typographi]